MRDRDIFFDAMKLYAISPTGNGQVPTARPGGHRVDPDAYAALARRVNQTIRVKWDQGEIAYHPYPSAQRGGSLLRPGADIRIRDALRPADYTSRAGKDALMVTAITLVHEACHLTVDDSAEHRLIDEVRCRVLELMFYGDLIAGLTLPATRFGSGGPVSVRLGGRAGTRASGHLVWIQNSAMALRRNRMIDYLLRVPIYVSMLDTSFVRQTQAWWGGLGHRRTRTLALYIMAVVAGMPPVARATARSADQGLLLDLLEAVPNAGAWQGNAQPIVSMSALRRALDGCWVGDPARIGQMHTLERRLGLWLDAPARPAGVILEPIVIDLSEPPPPERPARPRPMPPVPSPTDLRPAGMATFR